MSLERRKNEMKSNKYWEFLNIFHLLNTLLITTSLNLHNIIMWWDYPDFTDSQQRLKQLTDSLQETPGQPLNFYGILLFQG